ncbi:MAG: glutamate-5-semialdehyde dehydrogenase [Phycisphaerae bacterium]|nr:glutamate-5-semialdehyde dehydrogenase [Phycisphaerae bacterium]
MTAPAANLSAADYAHTLAVQARKAGLAMAQVPGRVRNDALKAMAAGLRQRAGEIVAANALDIADAKSAGLSAAMIDRLRVDEKALGKMAASVEQIAAQDDPVGQTVWSSVRPNGMRVERRRVPLGAVLIIFESRPNVTSDAAALCIKSSNACILRGGKEALRTNAALGDAITQAVASAGLPFSAVQMVTNPDRAVVNDLLKQVGLIDVAIPRGGESLIRAVVEQARIPVIKHYAGNCHVYVDAGAANLERMARDICVNAKCQRPGVCNAAETLLFHKAVADRLLPLVCADLAGQGVEVRGCERTRALFPAAKAATEDDWRREYLDLIVAVRVVDSLDAAIDHINTYGSAHTDAIVTEDVFAAEMFVARVDSGNVMVNVSTRFSDGGEYGLGAEIGISTDKLHARGPMGAADLTTTKYIVTGQGQLRG